MFDNLTRNLEALRASYLISTFNMAYPKTVYPVLLFVQHFLLCIKDKQAVRIPHQASVIVGQNEGGLCRRCIDSLNYTFHHLFTIAMTIYASPISMFYCATFLVYLIFQFHYFVLTWIYTINNTNHYLCMISSACTADPCTYGAPLCANEHS